MPITVIPHMKTGSLLLLVLGVNLLAACSPHPGAGKWKAVSDNELGIEDLSILYEGKAEFVTTKKDSAVWHCFWGKKDKNAAAMKCVPSSDPERREAYEFIVQSDERGELLYQEKVIAVFERKPYQ